MSLYEEMRRKNAMAKGLFSRTTTHELMVEKNGQVTAVPGVLLTYSDEMKEEHDKGQCDVGSWSNIKAVSAADTASYGLKYDGTVVCCGEKIIPNVARIKNIKAIVSGICHVVLLKEDGTVLAYCSNESDGKQCRVNDWTDIVAVSCSCSHTVGLKSDGTVVACGENRKGQCNVQEWSDIIDVFCDYETTVGLKSDGTLVFCGDFDAGIATALSSWRNIVSIDLDSSSVIGLKEDGTVVIYGRFVTYGDVAWKNIVAVYAEMGLAAIDESGRVFYRYKNGKNIDENKTYKVRLFNDINTIEEERKNSLKEKQKKETEVDKKDYNELVKYKKAFFKQEQKNKAYKVATIVGGFVQLIALLFAIVGFCVWGADLDELLRLFDIPVVGTVAKMLSDVCKSNIGFAAFSAIMILVLPFMAFAVIFIIMNIIGSKKECIIYKEVSVSRMAKNVKNYGSAVGDNDDVEAEIYVGVLLWGWSFVCSVVFIVVLLYMTDDIDRLTSLSTLFSYIISAVLCGFIIKLLTLPSKLFRMPFRMSSKTRRKMDRYIDEVDKIWLSVDTVEAEKRKKEEEEEYRAYKAYEKQIALEDKTCIVINYDSTKDTYGDLQVTVYIDDNAHRVHSGKNVFKVKPGFHELNCVIYDNYSDQVRRLNPLSCNLEPGQTHEIDIGM